MWLRDTKSEYRDAKQIRNSNLKTERPALGFEFRISSLFRDFDIRISHLRLVALEELHGTFVLLRRLKTIKGAEVAALAGLRVYLPRIEPVLTGAQFANNNSPPS